jgi:ADP-heptose:LPS heptosyltransferase
MPLTHIPSDLLQRSTKILFVAHLALGDFTYLQNCLRALSTAHPHLAIHVWVDELRRTSDATQWPHLQKYALYDWLRECPYIAKIYDQTYSPELLELSIRQAQSESYPIVVSLGLLRRANYARLARKLSPNGFVVGQVKPVHFLDVLTYLAYRGLNAVIPFYKKQPINPKHISAIYAGWFEQLFSITIPEQDRFPFVQLSAEWEVQAKAILEQWQLKTEHKIIFLNGFSKAKERSWSLERIIALAKDIKNQAQWAQVGFVVNVVPEHMQAARQLIEAQQLTWLHLFSAEENFFQLPALLTQCDLIISVETAVMHLANAVHVPVIALMRQTSPEWTPIDTVNSKIIVVKTPKGGVEEISASQVLDVMTSWAPAIAALN